MRRLKSSKNPWSYSACYVSCCKPWIFQLHWCWYSHTACIETLNLAWICFLQVKLERYVCYFSMFEQFGWGMFHLCTFDPVNTWVGYNQVENHFCLLSTNCSSINWLINGRWSIILFGMLRVHPVSLWVWVNEKRNHCVNYAAAAHEHFIPEWSWMAGLSWAFHVLQIGPEVPRVSFFFFYGRKFWRWDLWESLSATCCVPRDTICLLVLPDWDSQTAVCYRSKIFCHHCIHCQPKCNGLAFGLKKNAPSL